MATGQNNNHNPNRKPNGQPIKQPQKRRKKQQVPGAVIMIYVLMILLILSICALVFVITLNSTGWEGSNPGETESMEVSISSDSGTGSSSDSSNNSDENSSGVTSDESSVPETSSTTESEPQSQPDNSTSSNSTSGSGTTLPTNYNAEFFKDDLFIGDSIFTGLSGYGFIDQSQVAAAIGYTPYRAMHSTFSKTYSGSATDYAAEKKPKRIFIMLGSNVMGAGTNFDVIVTQYETMLQSLKQNCPDSEICVISIPPVTVDSSLAASSKISNSDIKSVNEKLKKMASRVGVGYLDLNSMLSDDSGYFMKQYAEKDGLHFVGITYRVLLSALQTKYKT